MPPFPTPAHHSLDALPISSGARAIYPLDFFPNPNTVRLPLGNTTYWLFGPEDGVKVVLVHGISTPSLLWEYIAPFLAENGFRVLVYDLFGRGYSEAPDTTYDANLYTTQLALLLQHVQFSHAHIIGLSMGGGVTAAFAATFPNLVTEKLIFIASVGLTEIPTEEPTLTTAQLTTSISSNQAHVYHQLREMQTEYLPGYAHAIASSYKDGPIRGLDNAFRAIAETPRFKSLVIHGTKDSIVDFRFGEKIKAAVPAAEFVPIEGADHDLIVADGYYEQVQTIILKFLQG